MQVESINFGSMAALKVSKPGLEMTIVTQVGPRIAELMEPGGPSILFWDSAGFKSTKKRGEWFLFGGHRVWTTRPGADECEETYAADNGLCTVRRRSGKGQVIRLVITGVEHPVFKTKRSLVIVDNGLDCSVDVINCVTNTSDMLWSGGLWGLTCTNPKGCRYFIPLPTGRPSSGWSPFSVTLFPHWASHTSGANFYKMVAYDPVAIDRCPNRSNFAFYIGPGNFMVEMEVMGPWKTLRPGETLELKERWVLLPPHAPENVDFGQLEQFRKGL